MTDNLTIFKGEYEKYKGQHLISGDKVYRFIGIVDDKEDYYYCLYDGRQFRLHSCVGRLVPLKGYIEEKHYNEFVRLAKLNHFDQVTLFSVEDKEKMKEFNDNHKKELMDQLHLGKNVFLTGPCWELN
jgi:hypothetical protein